MIPAVTEGVRSSVLPCSLTLIVPVVAVALAAWKRPVLTVLIAAVGALVPMWVRAAGFPPGGRWMAVVLAVLTLGVFAVWGLLRGLPSAVGVSAALIPGGLAGWVWQPCVGQTLGEILQAAGEGDLSSAVLLAGYLAGVLLPALVVVLSRVALGEHARLLRRLQALGTILGIGVAVLVVLGLESRVAGWLAAMSL